MIRQLTAKDAATYRVVRLQALQTDPDAFCSEFETEDSRPELFLEKCLKKGTSLPFLYGAFEGEELVGIAGFTGNELIQLYVSPPYRGKDIARELALAVIGHALRELKMLLYINVVVVQSPKNAGAFYKRLGFEPAGMDNLTHHGYPIHFFSLSRTDALALV